MTFPVLPVMSQKVTVDLKRSNESSFSLWRITNDNAMEVISVNDHLNEDSVNFSLEANRLYSLRIIVPETNIPFILSYTLGINGENILRIKEQLSEGEHEYKFFTGTPLPVSKIIGGTDASISDFPWQVYYRSGTYRCGAIILAPGWVLTAAHCTEDENHFPIPVDNMSITVGTEVPFKLNAGKTYLISEAIKHEAYNSSTFDNDIALLKLKNPIVYPNANPIKLVSNVDISDGAIAPGVMAWVTGWGLTRASPPVSSTYLQKVQLPIVSNEQASVVWPLIPSSDLMAGYLNGNKDACSGDSGGPLVVPVTGEYKLAGIVSWGNKTCDTYGAYTRVSDFINWISQKTGIIDYRPAVPGGSTVICNPTDTTQYNIDPFPGAIKYDWKLYPEKTGTIIGDSVNARVYWSQIYTGQAQVMVRTTVNSQVSDWSKLKVMVAPKRQIQAISNDTAICANLPLVLMVYALGDNLTYKWYRNNTLIPSGTSNFLSFESLDPVNSGVFRCDVSNICGTSSSDNINLTVLPPTTITDLTHDIDIPNGNNAYLEVTSEGHNLSYEWQKDGTLITDVNNPILSLYDVNTNDIGLYKVTVKGTCGNVTSDNIYVYVKNRETSGPVNILVWPTISSGEFNIAIDNDDEYTVQMYNARGSLIRELRNCRYQTSLYAGNLASGYYILNIFNTKFRKSIKVIKK